MELLMKKFLQLFFALSLFLAVSPVFTQTIVGTDPTPRNVVLEEFTGIYCGFCPYGHAKADSLKQAHPGRVVCINIHSGSFSIPKQAGHPDFQTPWGAALVTFSGLQGFPAGMVNRQLFTASKFQPQATNALALGRDGWPAALDSIFNTGNSAVNIGLAVERVSNRLKITVELYYTADAGQNNLLNVVLLESGVVGYQGGSLGSANYTHNNIMRDMITGQWGDTIKTTTKGTLVTKTYDYEITDRTDPAGTHLKIAAFVTQKNCKTIYTGTEVELPVVEKTTVLSTTTPLVGVKSQGTPFTKEFTIKNLTTNDITYELSVAKSDRTPSDWSAAITNPTTNTITVPAGDSGIVTASLTPGVTKGIGDMLFTEKETNTTGLMQYSKTVTVYSKEMDRFHIMLGTEPERTLSGVIGDLGYESFVDIAADDYVSLKNDFPDLKTIVWNGGITGTFTTDMITAVTEATDKGISQFICGNRLLGSMTTEAVATYGLEYNGYSTQGFGKSPWTVWFGGVDGDPVGDFLGDSVKGNLISYLITLFKVTDTGNTYPFIHFQNTGKRVVSNSNTKDTFNISGPDATFGFRVKSETARTVLFSITPYVISNETTRNKLLDNIMVWLDGKGPIAATDKSSFFFLARPGNTQEIPFKIMNEGEGTLQVTEMALEGDNISQFTLDLPSTLPLQITDIANCKLKFTPTAGALYNATLVIKTNSVIDSVFRIDILANSTTTDVPEYDNGMMALNVFPNPVTDRAVVRFSAKEGVTGTPEIALYDMAGRFIRSLACTQETTGRFQAGLDSEGLTNGTYMIKATANGYNCFVPVVIVK